VSPTKPPGLFPVRIPEELTESLIADFRGSVDAIDRIVLEVSKLQDLKTVIRDAAASRDIAVECLNYLEAYVWNRVLVLAEHQLWEYGDDRG